MTIDQIQKLLRDANRLPYAFRVEDGELFASFYELDVVAAKYGNAKVREMCATGIVTDKGFHWVA